MYSKLFFKKKIICFVTFKFYIRVSSVIVLKHKTKFDLWPQTKRKTNLNQLTMKTTLKTVLFIFVLGLSQIALSQDKYVKSFMKSHKNAPGADYVTAKSSKDFNFGDVDLSGVSSLLNNIGSIKLLSTTTSKAIISDFKRLKSKLNKKYETIVNISDNDGGISVFSDEDNGYLYALIQGDDDFIVVSLESKQ